MLNGFEDLTQPLNEYEEKVLLPVFIRCLSRHEGKDNAITNKQIVDGLKGTGYKCSDVTTRKIINHIRVHGLVPMLLASSNGYYVSHNRSEILEYLESLQGRENAIKAVRVSLENQAHINNKLLL